MAEKTNNESEQILKRVEAESSGIADSAMLQAAKTNKLGGDTGDDDPIEVLGTRIGRSLGVISFVVLAIYLLFTYVLPN